MIEITMKLYDGNMGDYWKDNYKSARVYKEFLVKKLRGEIATNYPLSDLSIDIEVIKNTIGNTPPILVESDDMDEQLEVENLITSKIGSWWDEFCSCDWAEKLYK